MSLKDIRSECSETASLLQPYVDSELSSEEEERVARHLEACRPCGAAVQEQHWVRATLRGLEQDRAPQALRARILLDLDGVDQEQAQAQAQARPGVSVWARLRDLAKGGLIMVPAGALAVGLFMVARQGSIPTEPVTGAVPIRAGFGEPREGAGEAVKDVAKLEPQLDFPVQIAGAELDRDVKLVGAELDRPAAGTARPRGARLEYRVLDPRSGRQLRVVDRQIRAGASSSEGGMPRGTRQVFRGGRTYYLDRAPSGHPVLHFVNRGVAHVLSLEDASGGPTPTEPGPASDEAAFELLLKLGDALDRTRARRAQ